MVDGWSGIQNHAPSDEALVLAVGYVYLQAITDEARPINLQSSPEGSKAGVID